MVEWLGWYKTQKTFVGWLLGFWLLVFGCFFVLESFFGWFLVFWLVIFVVFMGQKENP